MTELRTELESVRLLDPQQRGRRFERFLGKVFSTDRIRHRLSYRPEGEEIDGAIWWNQRTFLIEAKWRSEPLPASSIYAFKGKVDGKFAETLGLFVSMSGYSKDCAEAISHGKNLNILLFDGNDIESIADGVSFVRVLDEKLFAAGQTGQIYLPWAELCETQDAIDKVNQKIAGSPGNGRPSTPLIVICEGWADRLVIESLINHVKQQYSASFEPTFFVSQGKAPLLNSIAPAVVSLLSNGVSGSAAVMVVFDSDTTDAALVEQQRIGARKLFESLPPGWNGFVALAVPDIEGWVGLERKADRTTLPAILSGTDWGQRVSGNSEIAAVVRFLKDQI